MATITVLPNQSMADVIIMACGSMEGGMQFCADNNVAISDVPVVGAVYVVSDAAVAAGGSVGAGVLVYMQKRGIVVGTLAAVVAAGNAALLNDNGTPLLNDNGAGLLNDN